ncbi:MAG: accessory factor UbiK family protein [Pseudomonadota bacterium]|jgi:BMFP domain-containing protein YqiC
MMPHDRIGQLAQQIGERLQNASQAPEDIQKGVQQVVRGAFDRLELVSREDFDILMDVLQRTRTRVEALESQVAALEAALDNDKQDAAAAETTASSAPVETDETLPDAASEATTRREGDDN